MTTSRHSTKDIARLIDCAVSHGDAQSMGELSDLAVNIFRAEADRMGIARSDYDALALAELPRLRGLEPNGASMHTYLRMRRAGSRFRFSRMMRAAFFAQMVAKGLIHY